MSKKLAIYSSASIDVRDYQLEREIEEKARGFDARSKQQANLHALLDYPEITARAYEEELSSNYEVLEQKCVTRIKERTAQLNAVQQNKLWEKRSQEFDEEIDRAKREHNIASNNDSDQQDGKVSNYWPLIKYVMVPLAAFLEGWVIAAGVRNFGEVTLVQYLFVAAIAMIGWLAHITMGIKLASTENEAKRKQVRLRYYLLLSSIFIATFLIRWTTSDEEFRLIGAIAMTIIGLGFNLITSFTCESFAPSKEEQEKREQKKATRKAAAEAKAKLDGLKTQKQEEELKNALLLANEAALIEYKKELVQLVQRFQNQSIKYYRRELGSKLDGPDQLGTIQTS